MSENSPVYLDDNGEVIHADTQKMEIGRLYDIPYHGSNFSMVKWGENNLHVYREASRFQRFYRWILWKTGYQWPISYDNENRPIYRKGRGWHL